MNLHDPKFNRAESNQVGEPGGMMRTTDQGAEKIVEVDEKGKNEPTNQR